MDQRDPKLWFWISLGVDDMAFWFALWVLEQEEKAWDWFFPQKIPVDSRGRALSAGILVTAAAVQTGYLGSMPYRGLIARHGRADLYLRQVALDKKWYNPIGFKLGGKLGIVPKYATHSSARILGAKFATRFIPYVGVGLLMFDAWHVGKWIGHRLFD